MEVRFTSSPPPSPAAGTYARRREFDNKEEENGISGLESSNGSSIVKSGISDEGRNGDINEWNGLVSTRGSSNPISLHGNGESRSIENDGTGYGYGCSLSSDARGMADGERSFGSGLGGLEGRGFSSKGSNPNGDGTGTLVYSNDSSFFNDDNSKRATTSLNFFQTQTLESTQASEELLDLNDQLATWLEDCMAFSIRKRQQTQREDKCQDQSQNSEESKVQIGQERQSKKEERQNVEQTSTSTSDLGNDFDTLTSTYAPTETFRFGSHNAQAVDEEAQLLLSHLNDNSLSGDSTPSPSSFIDLDLDIDMSTSNGMDLGNALDLEFNNGGGLQGSAPPSAFISNHYSSTVSQMESSWSGIFA